ncbi:adenylate/guanylate cyclase domain-containing protein, partial [archaeon]
MTSEANQMNLQKYARHVPRSLTQQMLAHLIKQFMTRENKVKIPGNGESTEVTTSPLSTSCEPSVSRFYGALLFVDISGFTILSQRLPVDELRVHINSYFRKILNLIYNHGGDVIKFAGDALYALWKRAPKQDVYTALARAAKCGTEINSTCSHYRINFTVRDRDTSQVSDILLNEDESKTAPHHHSHDHHHHEQKSHAHFEPDYAFLDVHAGLAVGPMAGIDVGALDRWEYLIIGPPLKHVALAESEAQKGELLVSPIAHDILCAHVEAPSETAPVFCSGEPEEAALFVRTELGGVVGCGCFRTPGGAFRLNCNALSGKHGDIASEQLEEEKDDADYEFELQAMVLEDASEAFARAKPVLMEMYKAQRDKMMSTAAGANSIQSMSPRSGKFGDVNDDEGEIVFSYFLRWIESCMCDDLYRHVHEAVRGDYKMLNTNRRDCVYYCSKDVELATKSRRSSTASEDRSRRSSNSSSDSGGY